MICYRSLPWVFYTYHVQLLSGIIENITKGKDDLKDEDKRGKEKKISLFVNKQT